MLTDLEIKQQLLLQCDPGAHKRHYAQRVLDFFSGFPSFVEFNQHCSPTKIKISVVYVSGSLRGKNAEIYTCDLSIGAHLVVFWTL